MYCNLRIASEVEAAHLAGKQEGIAQSRTKAAYCRRQYEVHLRIFELTVTFFMLGAFNFCT